MIRRSIEESALLPCFRGVLSLLLVGALVFGKAVAAPLPVGNSEFSFADPRSNPGKPLTVWCYKPVSATRDSRVVFVMTGVKRNADEYRDNWARHADKHGFVLVVPQFPFSDYSNDDYTFGGVTQGDPTKWGFRTVDNLFDEIKRRDGLAANSYAIYGHSAGAQFVHRMMLFMGDSARFDTAIAANAGWYSMPVYDSTGPFKFPLALDARVVPEVVMRRQFAKPMFIMLGDQDTDTRHKHLNRSAPAMAQGPHRFARGQYFFRSAREQAVAMGASFNWRLVVVPGVAHSDRGMSDAAVKVLFPSP